VLNTVGKRLASIIHKRFLANVNSIRLFVLSVVCNARAPYTQPVEIFGNFSTPFSTVAIR